MPLRLYIRGGNAKLEVGIARGKKAHDKRRSIAERDMRRELEREQKSAGRIKLWNGCSHRPAGLLQSVPDRFVGMSGLDRAREPGIAGRGCSQAS